MYFLVACLAAATGIMLLLAGMDHARLQGRLRSDLAAQRVVPPRLIPTTAVTLASTEVVVGQLVLLVAAFEIMTGAAPLVLALAGMTFFALAVYGAIVLRSDVGDDAPCGCGSFGARMSALVVLRASVACVVLAGASMTSANTAEPIETAPIATLGIATALGLVGLFLPVVLEINRSFHRRQRRFYSLQRRTRGTPLRLRIDVE